MSLLVILMCFRAMIDCTELNAPLVIRLELTNSQCADRLNKILEQSKLGMYENPHGGHYALKCEPIEPKA